MLYNHVFNKHGEKWNLWSLCLSLSQLDRRPSQVTQTDWWSVVGIIDASLQRAVAKFFLSPQSTKMGHVSKTTPLLGVICHPFGQT